MATHVVDEHNEEPLPIEEESQEEENTVMNDEKQQEEIHDKIETTAEDNNVYSYDGQEGEVENNNNDYHYDYDYENDPNYNKLYNTAHGYPTYEEIQSELEQYKEYSNQLNNSIEQRDIQINQQYHHIKSLKDENKKLKMKVEKQQRILKAKERSFKREKEELQRENNNLAKQLKILETEVLNFMRSQGIEDADSFDSEEEDEEEEEVEDNDLYNNSNQNDIHGYVETVDMCVICNKAVGFCVHTKQSPKHHASKVFFPPDREEAVELSRNNYSYNNNKHNMSHPQHIPDLPEEQGNHYQQHITGREQFSSKPRSLINVHNNNNSSTNNNMDIPQKDDSDNDDNIEQEIHLSNERNKKNERNKISHVNNGTNRINNNAWTNTNNNIETREETTKKLKIKRHQQKSQDNQKDNNDELKKEVSPRKKSPRNKVSYANRSIVTSDVVETTFSKAFEKEDNIEKKATLLKDTKVDEDDDDDNNNTQQEEKKIKKKKIIPPPPLSEKPASARRAAIRRGGGKRMNKTGKIKKGKSKKYLINPEHNKSLADDLKAPNPVVNRLPQHLRRVVRNKNKSKNNLL